MCVQPASVVSPLHHHREPRGAPELTAPSKATTQRAPFPPLSFLASLFIGVFPPRIHAHTRPLRKQQSRVGSRLFPLPPSIPLPSAHAGVVTSAAGAVRSFETKRPPPPPPHSLPPPVSFSHNNSFFLLPPHSVSPIHKAFYFRNDKKGWGGRLYRARTSLSNRTL